MDEHVTGQETPCGQRPCSFGRVDVFPEVTSVDWHKEIDPSIILVER